eukprot:CAMPEP_0175410782 /NCGR_PEP_ID=MMETSP0095-20121207/41789_1 /TAXON_ID=311494 /ORGANISM="Alexandrium monilatum, Strain CCMP3105" /LENGTH=45 /DNA_ID= /DNA_START= /DNA_END= /DNA_ORIENTATION=
MSTGVESREQKERCALERVLDLLASSLCSLPSALNSFTLRIASRT